MDKLINMRCGSCRRQTPCRLSSANSNRLIKGATKQRRLKNTHTFQFQCVVSFSSCFSSRTLTQNQPAALCSAKDPLNQASWKRSALSRLVQIRIVIVGTLWLEKLFQKHRKLKCSKWGSRGPHMLHIKKEGPQMTLPKWKPAWYSNCGCFSQSLCRIYWMVAGSAINRPVSVFSPSASIKTQRDICKTRLLAEKKRGHGSWDLFSKLVLSTVSHIFVATKLQS